MDEKPTHTVVVLFYKYFVSSNSSPILRMFPNYIDQLHQHQHKLCTRLGLKGRVLLSFEGINGTVSASNEQILEEYMHAMDTFDLFRDCDAAEEDRTTEADYDDEDPERTRLYSNIDWKKSKVDQGISEPFPDLKISVVNEIVSSGGALDVEDIPVHGGKHLTPEEFHGILAESVSSNSPVVLIDVRNTFEHDIGHFINPQTNEPAMNPNMVAFSAFDATFCAKHAPDLKDKKVLMYCTGGIRCEKASAMLRKRGVKDVSQLKGGIHRYMEQYGDSGLFRGKNFVFDQRVALSPAVSESKTLSVVGKCVECESPYDEISGSRICTVCRDLVLVCPTCQSTLREYHCRRHAGWKSCYFTFLEVFDEKELLTHRSQLVDCRGSIPPSENKNMKRTLSRQIAKVSKYIEKLQLGEVEVKRDALRRCRTCMETSDLCDGRCWGFWKHTNSVNSCSSGEKRKISDSDDETIQVHVGDMVEPGSHWNSIRLGERTSDDGKLKRGVVVEIKSWGTGGNGRDCVAVIWNKGDDQISSERARPQIYRWGVRAQNGGYVYDVQKAWPIDQEKALVHHF